MRLCSLLRGFASEGKLPLNNSPTVAPGVVRSLYRMLLREVKKIDDSPLSKTLFPLSVELQNLTKIHGPLYFPNGEKYLKVLHEVFHDEKSPPMINLAFETLTRLRSHNEKVTAEIPVFMKGHTLLVNTMKASQPDKVRYRVERAACSTSTGSKHVALGRSLPMPSARLKLQQVRRVELEEGVALVAHPLSSTHTDRRVLLLYERDPQFTTGVVLDMLFTYPLSHGNPMFPEVFWGHTVYDGGVSQINFTMPPTAHISILHTLEPPAEPGSLQYLAWLKWKDSKAKTKTKVSEDPTEHHRLLCKPLIRGGTLEDGTVEPTLYLSKVEALPYLAQLAQGKPRSSLRVYWGSMRWPTRQLEAEVANGHWIPVKLSPTFFGPFPLASEAQRAENFPTAEELKRGREARERRHGVDVSLPQVFPPDRIMRRRECLWDQIMYCLGGEYRALVGCFNPFLEGARGVLPYEIPSSTVVGCGLGDVPEDILMEDPTEVVEREIKEVSEDVPLVGEELPLGAAMASVSSTDEDGKATAAGPPSGPGEDGEEK